LLGIAALVVAAAAFGACGSSNHKASSSSSTATVTTDSITIKDFSFSPGTITVAPGATITVHNQDSATHTVTAVSPHTGVFNTGDVSPGSTATFKAPTAPGTYPYICNIHQFMHGTLVVS
jgi:plastocyanin